MTEINHPVFARLWARMSPAMESRGLGEYRTALLAGLTGDVIEVGAGDGANFAYYPQQVTSVLAIEPEGYLREIAQRKAEQAPVRVTVTDGVADDLPVPNVAFDAAVTSLVLCSVSNAVQALTEIHRVLRDGGQLRYLEHVRADTPALARVQRVLDATIWPFLGGGCHASRDTAAAISLAGFTIDEIERFRFPDSWIPSPTVTNIRGVATRRDADRVANDGAG